MHTLPVPFWVLIALILTGIILLIFPAKFGKTFFGPKLASAMISEASWRKGQTLNALLYIIIGSISLAYVLFDSRQHALMMLLVMIGLQRGGLALIDRILKKKYGIKEESNLSN